MSNTFLVGYVITGQFGHNIVFDNLKGAQNYNFSHQNLFLTIKAGVKLFIIAIILLVIQTNNMLFCGMESFCNKSVSCTSSIGGDFPVRLTN